MDNLGTFSSNQNYVNAQESGEGVSASIDGRLQVNSQSPNPLVSVSDPISAHIPTKIKDKIWNGEFIDLNMLLKSAKDLANESNIHGNLAIRGGVLSIIDNKKFSIKNIHLWTSAFMIFMDIMLEKWPTKGQELLKYMQSVRLAASRGYSGDWVNYDEQYRLKKARYPNSSWAQVDMELWLICISSQRSNFVNREQMSMDNSVQGLWQKDDNSYPLLSNSNNVTSKRTMSLRYCIVYNKGQRCTYGRSCRFQHKCQKCTGNHPASFCKQ